MKSLPCDVADVQYKLKDFIDWKAEALQVKAGRNVVSFPF